MSLIRIILLFLVGYFLWRVIRSATRIVSNRQTRGEQDPFGTGGAQKPSQAPPYRDVRDANFEDITQKKDKEQPPPSGRP